MRKKMKLIAALAVLLAALPACQTNDAASTFKTFQDIWIVSSAAYDAHCERVVQGKVEPGKEAMADAAWNQFRSVFRQSFVNASRNWSAPAPIEVKAEASNLLTIIK